MDKEDQASSEIKRIRARLANDTTIRTKMLVLENSVAEKTRQLKLLRNERPESPDVEKIKEEEAGLQVDCAKLRVLQAERTALVEKEAYYDLTTQMLKDNGIKRMIVQKYIPLINTLVNNYLKKLGFTAKFVIDNEFQEKILASGVTELSYYNFSEGEKARIDVALLMAWREIASLRNNMVTNLLILDEVAFNGSLDDEANTVFIDLLKSLPASNVIVISHTIGEYAGEFDKTFRFKKVNGFSKYEEINSEGSVQ